jgi:hypothetical protein
MSPAMSACALARSCIRDPEVLALRFRPRASGSCSSSGSRRERGGLLLRDELLTPGTIEVPPRTRFSLFIRTFGRYKARRFTEYRSGECARRECVNASAAFLFLVRSQSVVATVAAKASAGVFQSSVSRGLVLSLRATTSNWRCVTLVRSIPLGKY